MGGMGKGEVWRDGLGRMNGNAPLHSLFMRVLDEGRGGGRKRAMRENEGTEKQRRKQEEKGR